MAIAGPLIKEPSFIMGDESKGNLDKEHGEGVLGIRKRLAEEFNQILLIVTQAHHIAEQTHRIIRMDDSKISS